MSRVYISAGEASGDVHAAELAKALRARAGPGLELFGMGGPAMAASGVRIELPIDRMTVMGFTEVLARLPRFWAALAQAERLARAADLAVLVDYPGFHLRLASRLAGSGVPVVIYIAPQVWAWRPGRAREVARVARKLLVIFEFELAPFRAVGADVEFVGHPLMDELEPGPPALRARGRLGLREDVPLVAILPGTRRQVVKRLLPVYLEAARMACAARPEIAVALGTRDGSPLELAAGLRDAPRCVPARELLRDATAGMFNSGTASLEAAILGCPGVVGYRMGWLNYLVARRVVTIPRVALPNIVYGGEAMRELIQGELRPAAVAAEILALVADPARREAARARLAEVRRRLGPPGASARAAEAVLKLLA